ncbi:MAG: FHA domain-containing protein [Opitutae bacterium]|jgi:hypothetical protein|nr:FHA domain-containing protein [Opitutae bacterium]MBT6461185.1 FHA domain-containing protein [Opitutae bacterium]MBT7852650.1 FHA domain-containing protein [Opitutae bacterium]
MSEDPNKIKITLDDLEDVQVPPSRPAMPQTGTTGPGTGGWGKVDGGEGSTTGQTGTASIFQKSWLYLGLAGFLGAFLAWALCEPFLDDDIPGGVASVVLFPLVITLISLGITLSELISERKLYALPVKLLVLLPTAAVIGCVISFVANILYAVGRAIQWDAMGDIDLMHPVTWIVRAVAWAIFGITGGVIYGISSKSGKKCIYGIIGGVTGAFLGGMLFDPISMLFEGAEVSRMLGIAILGTCTGVAIGLVESALKTRWLFVQEGPLAGKQFILYKEQTLFGNSPQCDIFLFKADDVQPQHAVIRTTGNEAILEALGPVSISGQPHHGGRHPLNNGDLVRISSYTFRYEEKRQS